jgi:hypothetical protein
VYHASVALRTSGAWARAEVGEAKQIVVSVDFKFGDMHPDSEPLCRGSGSSPHPHHRPGHSDVANDEIESVSRDYSDDDDLSAVFARLGFIENCTETFIFMLVALGL